jgi:hypothetical protein
MKKTGSHSGWCCDTAARKEVKEIRVNSTLHKLFLDSGHHKPEFSNQFKGCMALRLGVVLGRGRENHDFSVTHLNMNTEI